MIGCLSVILVIFLVLVIIAIISIFIEYGQVVFLIEVILAPIIIVSITYYTIKTVTKQNKSFIKGFFVALSVVVVGLISIIISSLADFSENQMILFLVGAISALCIFILYKSIKSNKQLEQEESERNTLDLLYSSVLSSYEIIEHTASITAFFDEFEKIEQKSAEIRDIGSKVKGGEVIIEQVDSMQIPVMSEKYQWMLRNAVERQAKITLKNIRTDFKNSAAYKQEAYNAFYCEVSEHKDLYNDETSSFINSLLDDLSYAVTGERRVSQSVAHDVSRERSLMSASLRYDIMKRDGFKCTICGRSQADGVKLHVDHILPVSKGGLTTPSNLRTLCQDCNLGKSDKYDESGEN